MYPYYFAWGWPYSDGKRKGHKLRVLWRGGRNSALVEWEDGRRDIISRNAIRKVKP